MKNLSSPLAVPVQKNFPWRILFGLALFFLLLAKGPVLYAQEAGQEYPYSLGGGAEMNLNSREGAALGYGAALDRHIGYIGDQSILLAGVKAALNTNFSGINGSEVDVYLRLYVFKYGFSGAFTQLGWGYASYREDVINAQTMLMEFTVGWRQFFLDGFYVEPYFRTGFPYRIAVGLMAGHWFDF
jgi:hypothetical protein